jgi:hypothetical protein
VKVEALETELSAKKSELENITKLNDRMRERLRQFQATLKESLAKESQMLDENAALKTRAEALERRLQSSERALPATLATMSTQPETKQALLTQDSETTPQKNDTGSLKEVPVKEVAKPASAPKPKLPSVPAGGFKYGPSESSQPKQPASGTVSGGNAKARTASSALQAVAQAAPVGSAVETKDAATNASVIKSPQSAGSSLRREAKPFVPTAMVAHSASDSSNPPISMNSTLTSPSVNAVASVESVERRGSSETKELSIKQKLLEKKRKQEQALAQQLEKKRKLEEDMARKKADAEIASETPVVEPGEATAEEQRMEANDCEAVEDHPAKPSKAETASREGQLTPPSEAHVPEGTIEVEAAKEESDVRDTPPEASEAGRKPLQDITPPSEESKLEKAAESHPSQSVDSLSPLGAGASKGGQAVGRDGGTEITSAGNDIMDDETVKDAMSPHPLDEEAVDDASEMDAAADGKEEEVPMEEEGSKTDAAFGSGTAFGSGAGTAFGSGAAWGSNPTTFGETSTLAGGPASFRFSGQVESSTVSSSFLNIKPPGTSTEAPVFSFGHGSSITLPTPSLPNPAATSPFGAFASSTVLSFGGFGSTAPGGSVSALPLFGSSPFGGPATSASGPQILEATDGGEEMEDGEGEMDAES